MDKLIDSIDEVVKKAPALPANIKEFLVKFSPWGTIITVVLSAPAALALIGLGTYFGTFGMRGYGYRMSGGYGVTLLLLAGVIVLRAVSIPGLFSRSSKGWKLFFYSVLLYFVYAVFARDVVGGVISTAISLYLAFQVREYFK